MELHEIASKLMHLGRCEVCNACPDIWPPVTFSELTAMRYRTTRNTVTGKVFADWIKNAVVNQISGFVSDQPT